MKNLFITILAFFCFSVSAQEKKGETKTVTFKVLGNCEQCKSRIENAADIKGVKLAEWDAKTQSVKVIYKTDKVTEEQIKKAILNAGHDVEGEKAPDSSYKKLPDCCKFRDGKCEKK